MSDISLSKAVRSNLLSLQNTSTMMAKTQDRLATGNKVNSALDNPTNFFTAASLNSRAGDLNQLMDSMANGIQTLEAADNGLTSITKTLESMQSTLRQARQDKTFQTESLELAKVDPNADPAKQFTLSGGAVGNPVSFDMVVTGTGDTASTTAAFVPPAAAGAASYAGTATVAAAAADDARTFTVSFGGKSATITLAADVNRDDATKLATAINAQLSNTELAGQVTASQTAGKFTLTGPAATDGTIAVTGTDAIATFGDPADATPANQPTATAGSDGKTEFTVNGKKISLDTTTGADADTAIASINTQLGADKKFEAFKEIGGKLAFRALTDDAGKLTIGGADANLFGTPTGGVVAGTSSTTLKFAASVTQLVSKINTQLEGKVRASNDNGKLRIENLSTQALTVEGKNATTSKLDGTVGGTSKIAGNSVRSDLASQFNELRDQLDKLSDDASFNGINLLRGDNLKITFNETGTSSIDIRTKSGEALSSSSLNINDIEAIDLDSDTNIDSRLASLKLALSDVRSQSSTFGSNLSIVQNRQDFTKNMINTLETGAANLTLADMNEEAANLLALQTRQSLSSSSLSLASQADQSVLQLLQ